MDKILILFDIDWTLLRGGLSEHIDGFSYAWKKVLGIDAKLSDWPDHHGQPDVVLLSKVPELCHGIGGETITANIEKLKQAKTEYFFSHAQKDYSQLILPGVKQLLEILKSRDIPMSIKSGNLEKIGMARLERSGLATYFTTGGWGDNVSSKSESTNIAIENSERILQTKFAKDNIFDVGDSKYDVSADKETGINSIAVCTGYDSKNVLESAGAVFILHDLTQQKQFLDFIKR